jgi:hypothetical protein
MTVFLSSLELYRSTDPKPVDDVVARLRKQERAADRQPLPISTADSLVIEDGLFKLNTPEGPMPLTLAAARDLGGFVGLQSTTINNLESIGAINALAEAIHVACRKHRREVVVNTTMTRRRGKIERIIDSVVSSSYQHLPHSEALASLLGNVTEDAMVVDLSISDRLMRARVSTEPFEYGKRITALDVSNSLTRASSLTFSASDFNPFCSNGMVIIYAILGQVSYRHTRHMLETIKNGSKSRPALAEVLPQMIEESGMGIAMQEGLKDVPVIWSPIEVETKEEYATPAEAFVKSKHGLATELRKVGGTLPAAKKVVPFIVEGLTHETTSAQGTASAIVDAMTYAAHASGVGLEARQLTEEGAARLMRQINDWRKQDRETVKVLRNGALDFAA